MCVLRCRVIILVIGVLGSLLLSTGCLAPWAISGVNNPNVTPDNFGGAIIVYQVYEGSGRTAYAQRVSPEGDFLWTEKGVALYSVPGRIEGGGLSALMVSDGGGGTIFVWEQGDGLWAQRVDSEGHFLWQAGGIQIYSGYVRKLEMASDNSGGAIVAWCSSYDELCLQKIDSQGNLLWMEGILIFSGASSFDMASDSAGTAFVAWQDKDYNTLIQKVDSKGQVLWQRGGLLVCAGHGDDMYGIIADASGGAIVVWIYEVRAEDVKSITLDLYSQRINAEGKMLWQPEGVSVCTGSQGADPVEPQIVGDGSGGAIIFWRDPRNIYAQRIDSKGNALWVKGGIQVWEAEGPQSPYYSVTEGGSGGAIIVWRYVEEGKTVDQGGILRAQKLDANGEELWQSNGTQVSTASWGYCSPAIISQDGYGGVIVSWAAGRNIHNASLSYVQKIDTQGNRLWGDKGIRLD